MQGDILIGATWSQIQRLLVFPWFDRMENCNRAFPGTAGWTLEGRILSFPGVSPSRTSASARTEGELLCRHVVGAAHPRGWEHVGAPERALRGGSCFPRIPGSHASDLVV